MKRFGGKGRVRGRPARPSTGKAGGGRTVSAGQGEPGPVFGELATRTRIRRFPAMETNGFDPSVMPSARGARAKEWRMLGGVPMYLIAVFVISAFILGIVAFA